MNTLRKFTLFSLVFLLFQQLCFSQKVAVVLSGGGAKGAAHVGFLKALEENNIPIDYIAGTSMGAIVGSFYAAGYTPDQIEKIITSEEFLQWAKGEIEDKYIYYFKKYDDDASWINLKFNYDSALQYKLPTNFIAPYQIDFGFLYYLAAPGAAAGNNFDSLYIPFRCVASDIEEKKAVSFASGYLPEAVRASMTYPFYFKPIKIDNRLLFDGGMYNNFPADIVIRDFKPDVVFGCNVSGNSDKPDEADILTQIENMLTTNTDYNLKCEKGVMVCPDMKGVSTFDFERTGELIKTGYDATIAKIDDIKKLIDTPVSPEDRQSKRNIFLKKIPKLVFDSISVDGVNHSQSIYIKKSIISKDSVFGAETFKRQYFKLLADDKVESIYPKAHYHPETKSFMLNLNIKRNRNFNAQFGGIVSSGNINGAYLGIQYRYLGLTAVKVAINTYIGRFYSSLQGKVRFEYPYKVPFYMDFSIGYNKWDYFKTTTRFLEEKLPSNIIKDEILAITDFGFPAARKGKFIFGISLGRIRDNYYQNNSFSKSDTADITTFDFFSARNQYSINSLNKKQFATAGKYLTIDIRYILGNERNVPGSTSFDNQNFYKTQHWLSFKLSAQKIFSKHKIYRPGLFAEILISNKPLFNNYTSSVLSAPAFQPTPESKVFFLPNFRSNNYIAVGFTNVINIYKRIHFRLEGYFYQPYQEILSDALYKAYYSKPFEFRSVIGYAALVYDSPICPLSVSVSYYQRRSNPVSVMFNIGYIIFNRKALE
jgi:NTE family protein